jgi:hypothetical protein
MISFSSHVVIPTGAVAYVVIPTGVAGGRAARTPAAQWRIAATLQPHKTRRDRLPIEPAAAPCVIQGAGFLFPLLHLC